MIKLLDYIPREYLALKINYCRQQLKLLPNTRIQIHKVSGIPTERLFVGNHRYNPNSPTGQKYMSVFKQRDELERQLRVYLSIWDYYFKDEPLPECEPHPVNRTLCIDAHNRVIMNRAYFDSLENDANKKYPKPKDYPFNGIYYRSSAEREIAIFYTEMGIPFKYEPAILIKDITTFSFPDFVLYIPELDNCKIHEHFGMKDSASYLKITKNKYYNYTNAGLVPELDIIFTHDVEEVPFDIRYAAAKLNTAIYGTMIATNL